MSDLTIYRMLKQTVDRHGSRPALGMRRGDTYATWTYLDLLSDVRRVRNGLAKLGFGKGERIAILSENRPEWAIADIAAHSLGVVVVPIYPSLPERQVRHIVGDSAARLIIVSDTKQIVKAKAVKQQLANLEHIVLLAEEPDESAISWRHLMEIGANSGLDDAQIESLSDSILADDVATLIYTSGTTGDPKGAILTHRSLLHTAQAALSIVKLDENDVFLSFLPLSHIIERAAGFYLPLLIGAQIVYSEGLYSIGNELTTVQPTLFMSVPRLYDAICDKILDHAVKLPSVKRTAFQWAMSAGRRYILQRRERGKSSAYMKFVYNMADKLVLREVRKRVVGERIRYFISGGAPLNQETMTIMQSLGMNILQGYGLTEFPVATVTRPGKVAPGTVGTPLDGVEVQLASDGEILLRGESMMRGYFGKPKETSEVIDGDGWFHTGDVGELDTDGNLQITDRKKDILVLSNGKNVSPQPIEARLKTSRFIAEAVLIGDHQATVTALIVPNFERLLHWAREKGIQDRDIGDLIANPEIRKLYRAEIDGHSEGLADFERVRGFTILSKPFGIESGELTPTMKVKRPVVTRKYVSLIEQMSR